MVKALKVTGIVLAVLFIDQFLKIWIKTSFCYGEEVSLMGDWAKLHFVENPGMAFGLEFGGNYGKLFLSLFRIVAVFFLIYYISVLIKSNASRLVLVSFALILAGAIGNILDSAFYGLIFSESSYHCTHPAVLFPAEGGYAGFLHGKVVDMLYFPIWEGTLPDWVPFWGGEEYMFFRPVFNVADSAISIGVAIILLFQRSFFKQEHPKPLTVSSSLGGGDLNQEQLMTNEESM